MYELLQRLSLLLPGVIVTCVALAAAHLGLWGSQLSRPAAYVIGSACVLLGVAVSALVLGDAWPFVVYAIHLGAGGGVILLAWAIRGHTAAQHSAEEDARAIREAAERERTDRTT